MQVLMYEIKNTCYTCKWCEMCAACKSKPGDRTAYVRPLQQSSVQHDSASDTVLRPVVLRHAKLCVLFRQQYTAATYKRRQDQSARCTNSEAVP